jgi:predicted dehydrogenase
MLAADQTPIRLITLDPGHFHASLVQKEMYPGVSPRVTVYAPLGFDLTEHLNRVARFNLRPDKPTHWELDIHTSDDPLAQMLRERPGNVVVIAGRNRPKIDRIQASVNAGLNVLSDKPWVIRSADLPKVAATLDAAEKKGLVAYDLMTERCEATNYIQKELVDDPGVFGMIVPGDAQNPGVYMESIHWLLKTVDGAPLLRPVWFFDTNEQGEGLSDVGTHLVDLAAWTLFPQTILDYREDVKMEAAERFPTPMTAAEYKKVTGAAYTSADGVFNYYCNTKVQYALRGVHIKLDVLWKYQNPTNGPDTLVAVYRGTRSRVEVREGEVYVIPVNAADKVAILNAASKRLAHYGDVKATDAGDRIKLNIPSRLRVGHEAHFAQVAAKFFEYLKNPASMPVWEKANMLAKYYVTTMGVDMSQQSKH